MSRIYMLDMGFGDGHILVRDNYPEMMLVDFGSKNSGKAGVNANVIPIVRYALAHYVRRCFLLTHFHNDHYNQISKLRNNIFDEIYLRNIYDSRVTVYRSIYELMVNSVGSSEWREALNTILCVPYLARSLRPCGKFVFVRRGSTFTLNGEVYNVYKPDVDEVDFRPLRFEEEEVNTFINNMVERIDNIGRIINRYREENANDGTISFTLNHLDEEEDLMLLSDEIQNYARESMIELSQESRYRMEDFINTNDEHKYNIIFGLEDGCRRNHLRLLMCGDALPEDVTDVINNHPFNHIDVMKVPHHGTPRYYPNLANVVVDNTFISYSYPINSFSTWTIDNRYYNAPFNNVQLPFSGWVY